MRITIQRSHNLDADTAQLNRLNGDISIETSSSCIYIEAPDKCDSYVNSQKSVTVVVQGELYDDLKQPARYIGDAYNGDVLSLARSLNGSFIVVIVDSNRDGIYLITDRVNSRRLFVHETERIVTCSTSLTELASLSGDLDSVGVAWYLSNGVVNNGRTIYRGVRVLDRASVFAVTPKSTGAYSYWSFDFFAERSSLTRANLRSKLQELVEEAVRRCVQDEPDVFLSLSGGYDASAIGGALRYGINYPRVSCFSYAMGEALPGTDERLARDMATVMGYSHELVQAYDGNFMRHLRLNGERSGGFANPCDEINAYDRIAQRFHLLQNPVFFTGSEWFGDDVMDWRPLRLRRPQDVLRSAGIYQFSRIRWIKDMMPNLTYSAMTKGLDSDYWAIWERCPFQNNLYDAKDYLYLSQRLPHHNMPWWSCYPGRLAPVRMPLLDRDILEFMVTVPTLLRRDKRLWRETASAAYPDIYGLPRTRSGSYEFDVKREVVRNRTAIEHIIRNTRSPLDELIPPDTAMMMLDSVTDDYATPLSTRTRAINLAKRVVPRRLRRRIRSLWPPSAFVPEQEPEIVLRRLLVLREAMRLAATPDRLKV